MKQVYDVLIAGGGTGGVAAALRATAMGCTVVLIDENEWLGGQMTSQGLSALDEHKLMETFGGTTAYYEFRSLIRQYYRARYNLSAGAEVNDLFNPGCSRDNRRMAFEPCAAEKVLNDMLLPAVNNGRLTVIKRAKVEGVNINGSLIKSVLVKKMNTNRKRRFEAAVVIDATELGDLLPLSGIPYSCGEDSFEATHEPNACESNPKACQAFGYSFALEYIPGTNNVISKPSLYEEMKKKHHFSLNGMQMLKSRENQFSFWEYRQVIDAKNFDDPEMSHDITVINCTNTGCREDTLIDQSSADYKRILYRAKQQALSYLYWLQTEAPRDDGGEGYPELKLRPDLMGTKDGLSQYPYIRESRRIIGLDTIKEQDVVANYQNGSSRARMHHDSVGIGWYGSVDIQWCCHSRKRVGSGQRLLPFQIPMGAVITGSIDNFIAGAKNISTTHITNGAYRLHPVEWSIGEAAGALAAYACRLKQHPRDIYFNKKMLRQFQIELLLQGVPIYWFDDVGVGDEAFLPVQYLAIEGIIPGAADNLHFNACLPVQKAVGSQWIYRAKLKYGLKKDAVTWLENKITGLSRAEFAKILYNVISYE